MKLFIASGLNCLIIRIVFGVNQVMACIEMHGMTWKQGDKGRRYFVKQTLFLIKCPVFWRYSTLLSQVKYLLYIIL